MSHAMHLAMSSFGGMFLNLLSPWLSLKQFDGKLPQELVPIHADRDWTFLNECSVL